MEALLERISSHKVHVGVVGLGYVGLPLALRLADVGFKVTGLEKSQARVDLLHAGEDYINGHNKLVREVVEDGRMRAVLDPAIYGEVDIVIVCVPTPLSKNREPDISYVVDVSKELASYIKEGQMVILESTTFPGTTEEVMVPILEESGLKAGEDFYVAYSPERVDPGNLHFDTSNTPKIVGGINPVSSELAQALYQEIIPKVHVASSPKTAELVKLHENIFRSVNIALVNELALLCRLMEVDVWEVVDLAATKPYGFMPFYPGPGLGGHCIPIDPFYLTWKAREFGFRTKFIELAGEINIQMPRQVLYLMIEALGSKHKSLRGSKVLVVGVAYKKDVADVRESPALKVMELASAQGGEVSYYDPLIPSLHFGSKKIRSIDGPNYEDYDCVVIITPHTSLDYDDLVNRSELVVDTRNATHNRHDSHVFVLGVGPEVKVEEG